MENNTPYALFFDIDGTIAHKRKISKYTAEVLKMAHDAGHYLFINTGRSRGNLPKCLFKLPIWDGYVCGGAYAEVDGAVVLDERIDKAATERLLIFCRKNKIRVVLEGVDAAYALGFKWFGLSCIRTIQKVLDNYDKLKVTKISILKRLTDEQKQMFEQDFNIVRMPHYTEAYKKGYSKASGMRVIADKLGIDQSKIVAFGDSQNDEDMLKYAGTRVVMCQAPDAIKQLADIVTQSPKDGAAEGIIRLNLHKKL